MNVNNTAFIDIDSYDNSVFDADVVYLTKLLIEKKSITPLDSGCQKVLATRLEKLGFDCIHFNDSGVQNMIAIFDSNSDGPTVAFAGHTDVVPPGDLHKWEHPPFSASISNGFLYGRGVADMKGGIAAMVCSLERYLSSINKIKGKFLFLITSDEEGEAEFGSRLIVQHLEKMGIIIDYCLIGEPTANLYSGDTIKVGRRGSISGLITVQGKAGHVAYPQYAINSISTALIVSNNLNLLSFEKETDNFPGTNLEISGIKSSSFIDNVIPGKCEIRFNIRFDNKYDVDELKRIVEATF